MKWPVACLGGLCQINIGRTPSRSVPTYWEGGNNPWLSISDMGRAREISESKEGITDTAISDCNMRLVQAGTVLFSFKLSIGKLGIAATPLFTNEAIASLPILDRSQLCEDYLFHALRQVSGRLVGDRAAMGITLNKASLAQIEIPLPPLEEQRRIAAILDKAGNLRQHANGQLCQAKDLLASLFIETIGEPRQNPHNWSTLPLAEAVQAGTDVTYGIVQAGEEFPGGIPYIRTGDIVDGEIDVSALRHTDPAIASRFIRSTVRTGEIIMSIRATVGTTAVVPPCLDGANLTQGTARVAPGKNVNGVYLLQYLRMPSTQAWIQRQVKGATFREITLARLRELPVLIPPMAIQDKFAAKAMLASSAIDSSKVLLSRIENLSLSLGNQLLAQK